MQSVRRRGLLTFPTGKEALFFLSKVELKVSDKPGMSRLRKELFLATSLISAEPADYFRLPPQRTVILGAQIEF